jgi:hypothetical protein
MKRRYKQYNPARSGALPRPIRRFARLPEAAGPPLKQVAEARGLWGPGSILAAGGVLWPR